jgi:signal transduction histidine kinase
MQSLGKIASGIAHEFNNLLTGINGYASLGMREPEVSPVLASSLRILCNYQIERRISRQFLT